MVGTRTDYPEHAVQAARAVLLELAHLFTSYGDEIVVVGGWVPELLLSSEKAPHIGSTDVDVALVQRVGEAHGGEVTALNCPDGGAAFTLRIPLLRIALEAAA